MDENEIGTCLVETATNIHREVGPGLLEKVYETILVHNLVIKGLNIKRQVSIPVEFNGFKFEEGFRADIIIENKVIVELKCVEKINIAHRKQLLTYLNLTDMRLGYILNFNEALMKRGIHRMVNNLPE